MAQYISPEERRKLQQLYPEAKDRYGMDARKPTEFRVPVIKLSLLLFFPIFFVIAFSSIQTYTVGVDYNKFAVKFIAIFAFIILSFIAALVLLGYARSIIVRNCNRSWFVEGIYVALIIPAAVLFMFNAAAIVGSVTVVHLIIYEAVFLYAACLVNALIARQLSR